MFNKHQFNFINVELIIYLSVDRMCNSLSRNSLNICGHVEDRCTCNLVKNSCKACVAVGPTWKERWRGVREAFSKYVIMKPVTRVLFIKLNTCELCWLVPWGFPPDRKRTSTCTSVGSDTICWAVLSCTPIPLLEAADAIYTLSAELIRKCVTRLFAFIIRLWRGNNTDLLSWRDSRRENPHI